MRFAHIPYSFALNLKASFLNPETSALNPKATDFDSKVFLRVKSFVKSAAHFNLLLIKETIDSPR